MKDFTIYENGKKTSPLFLILRSAKTENEDHLIEEIKNITDKPFNIAVYKAEDWNHDYSPWCAPGMDEASPFTGGGDETMKEILSIVEELKKTYSGEILIQLVQVPSSAFCILEPRNSRRAPLTGVTLRPKPAP